MNTATLQRRFKLLTIGNPKTLKGEASGYLTAILHFAPSTLSGFNVCKYANACKAPCLNTAGRGGMFRQGESTNAIQRCRIRRTELFFRDRRAFFDALTADLIALREFAAKHDMKPACRLNGTSDLPWESIPYRCFPNIYSAFPGIRFYDYTKYPLHKRNPGPDYHLTFSLDVGMANACSAIGALKRGVNVAVAFRVAKSKPLPKTAVILATGEAYGRTHAQGSQFIPGQGCVVPVIDGDEHDLRFLDPRGVVVGLRAKGRARKDTSGFVKEVRA